MSAGLCPLACVRWLARKVDIVTACTASTCLKGYVGVLRSVSRATAVEKVSQSVTVTVMTCYRP